MPTTIYDSSLITQRNREKTISGSFINRIQSNGYAPRLGISEQSIINTVTTGQMTQYRKHEGGEYSNKGCPCSIPSIPLMESYGWIARMFGSTTNYGNSLSTDSTGVYVTGLYSSPITIYDVSGTSHLSLTNTVPYECFIAKYNKNGYALWATRISGSDSLNHTTAIVSDLYSNCIYITGIYSPDITIYDSDGTSHLSLPPGSNYGFIVKYNEDGYALWATYIDMTGIVTGDSISEIGSATDSTGVYIIGFYSTTISIYNSDGTSSYSLPSIGNDIFIIKYDTDGYVVWATHINGGSNDAGYVITTDSTGVYVSGRYSSPITIYDSNGTSSYSLPSSGYSGFIIKYNNNGNAVWATRITGVSYNIIYAIVTDSTGVYVSGRFDDSISIYDSNNTLNFSLTSSGDYDGFIIKYDINGYALWATHIGGGNYDAIYAITIDSTGVYVTGIYFGSTTVYNKDGSSNFSLTSDGEHDCFIIKYNTDGYALWATHIGGISYDNGFGITTDSTGVYVTGSYLDNINIYNSNNQITPVYTLPGSDSYNSFIVKYNRDGIVIHVE